MADRKEQLNTIKAKLGVAKRTVNAFTPDMAKSQKDEVRGLFDPNAGPSERNTKEAAAVRARQSVNDLQRTQARFKAQKAKTAALAKLKKGNR